MQTKLHHHQKQAAHQPSEGPPAPPTIAGTIQPTPTTSKSWMIQSTMESAACNLGMHFWLRFETNGTTIEEHMAFVRVITVNNHKEMEFDRYDGNYNRTLYGSFKAMGLLVKHLAANHWTNTDTTGRMRYAWWHIYDNADYAVTPANHGNYLGDLATFRRNFCLRNGLAGQ